jgi:hypothetical protein
MATDLPRKDSGSDHRKEVDRNRGEDRCHLQVEAQGADHRALQGHRVDVHISLFDLKLLGNLHEENS